MTTSILNLADAPSDSLERLLWLSGVAEEAKRELDSEFQETYFNARLERRLDAALELSLHRPRRVLAWTRAENERRGRSVRWGDYYL